MRGEINNDRNNNMFINMNYRLIYEYIKNRCIETDSIRAFITTTNKQVFERAKELFRNLLTL